MDSPYASQMTECPLDLFDYNLTHYSMTGAEDCPALKKVGCYADHIFPNRPLPDELLNRRDPINHNYDGMLIDWGNYPDTLKK